MVKQPPKPGNKFADLPVLTEVSDTDTKLPVLTEILAATLPPAKPGAAPLTDAQCRQLAAQIAPYLESLLRDKFSAQLDTLWPEIWREVQAELPKLVRAQLAEPARRRTK
jgi:hypothetical protein